MISSLLYVYTVGKYSTVRSSEYEAEDSSDDAVEAAAKGSTELTSASTRTNHPGLFRERCCKARASQI